MALRLVPEGGMPFGDDSAELKADAWLTGGDALAGPGARGVLACQVPAPVTIAPGIRAVPWHLAWCR